jgi:fatty-acid desaturase
MVDYLNSKLASILTVVGVSCASVVLFELFVMSNWSLLWWYFVGTILMMVLASAFYHRQVCHKTWDCPNWLRVPFTFVAGGLGLAPAIQWCAIHRQHHAHPDQEEDAHGPHFPIWHNLAVSFIPPKLKYVRDLLQDDLYKAQYKYYIPSSIITAGVFSATFGFAEWCFVYVTMVGHQVASVYTGHWKWFPKNNFLAAIYSPEIYHDEHHKDAQSSRLGKIDIPYWLLIQWFPHKLNGNKGHG